MFKYKTLACDCCMETSKSTFKEIETRPHNFINFVSQCKVVHEILTAICDGCYFETMADFKEFIGLRRCQCGTIRPYEICDFCSTLKYLFNHKILKICVDKTLFEKFSYKVVPLNNHFKSFSVDSFFIFDSESVVV